VEAQCFGCRVTPARECFGLNLVEPLVRGRPRLVESGGERTAIENAGAFCAHCDTRGACLLEGRAVFDAAVDVLDLDDGIVDHETYREW